jgi:hypothetical protein
MVDTHCIDFTNIYWLRPFEEIVAVFVKFVCHTNKLCEYKRGVCTLEVHARTKQCFIRDEA